MAKLDTIPDTVRASLSAAGVDAAAVQVAALSDMAVGGTFGQCWLLVTDTEALTLDAAGKVAKRVALKGVQAVRVEHLVGGGALLADMGSESAELVRYSNAEGGKFGYLARWLTEGLEHRRGKRDEAPVWDYKPEKKFCRSCGLPLPDEFSPCPACTKKSRALRRMLGYLRPYTGKAALLTVFSVAGVGLELIPPYFTRVLLDDVLLTPEALAKTPATPVIGPWFRDLSTVAVALAVAVALVGASQLIATVLGIFRGRMHAWLGLRLATDIRAQLFRSLHSLSLRFFDKRQTGTVISHVTHDTERIYFFLVDGVQMLVRDVLIFFGIIAVLLWMNWRLTLYVLVPVPVIFFSARWFWHRVHSIFHRAWHRHSKLHDVVNDSITGVRVVRAFAQEQQSRGRFEPVNEEFRQYATRGEQLFATFFPLLHATVALGAVIIWYVGGREVLAGHGVEKPAMTLGTLMAFMAYLWRFYAPMMDSGPLLNWSSRCLTAAERIFEVLDAEPEQTDDGSLVELPQLRGAVCFKDLSFGYELHKPVLKQINLDVKPGEMIGLVGHSGAGKSTLINLICRFYECDTGTLSIDGHDIRKIELAQLRRRIGVVLQDPFLFNGSIAENIAFAKPGAEMEQIVAAATAANAHEFIVKLPDGYDTEVGERGSRLSTGERQRVSIARAILHDPRILILDEATSSVDVQTEKKIQQAVNRLVRDRTTFAIAHRLSTLRNAHRLFVLKDGKGIECGTHDELMAKKGEYFSLVKTQREASKMRGEAEAVAG